MHCCEQPCHREVSYHHRRLSHCYTSAHTMAMLHLSRISFFAIASVCVQYVLGLGEVVLPTEPFNKWKAACAMMVADSKQKQPQAT
jgi:hypothetical protein